MTPSQGCHRPRGFLPLPGAAHHAASKAARIPLGRRGQREEVATWILRLVDPATTWLTGQVPAIDGGLNLTKPTQPGTASPAARHRSAPQSGRC
ncbi:SDR family oxidoreductase [Nonomuraea sp. NPDC049758]|uniref:SDR family oxidoreductase n=1 Tax=Nonomuraea sp. NPDC049758 TaxID=3154360 RepID=UPI00343889F4